MLKLMPTSDNAPEPGGFASDDDDAASGRGTWNSIPEEMQIMILQKVDTRDALLTCRLVHTSWKKVADASLEKLSIIFWTKWDPFLEERFLPKPLFLPEMKLVPDWYGETTSDVKWNHSSIIPLVENPKLWSPFPTSSMKIIIDTWEVIRGQWPGDEMARVLLLNHGHYLTSFYLSHFMTNNQVFNEIISNMSNLKALALIKVELRSGGTAYPLQKLPPLPKLAHLITMNCDTLANELVFYSYSSQLNSLRTNAQIDPGESGCVFQPFTNLKKFKLKANYKPNLLFPQLGPNPFPALEYFSVIHTHQPYEMHEIIQAVDNLPNKLVDLHLNVVMLINQPDQNMAILNLQNSNFEKLKTLGIPFPRTELKVERTHMWLSTRFPNLRVLNLLHSFDECSDEVAGFFNVCPNLENILVHEMGTKCAFDEYKRNS